MTVRIVVYLIVFWLMQVTAQIFFKWGSMSESRWIWGFLGGNLFGFSSIWLLMLVYKAMNPNIALGIATGGAFLLSQIALVFAFKSKVAPMQWAGITAIVVGMIALAAGMTRETETGVQQTAGECLLSGKEKVKENDGAESKGPAVGAGSTSAPAMRF